MPKEPAVAKLIAALLLAVALMVGAMSIRLIYQSRTHLAQGLAAIDASDHELAVTELEDAAKAYLPFSPFVARAHEELAILAKTAQMRGDRLASLRAWEALRRSVLATRHVVVPNRETLERANNEIARLNRDNGMSAEEASATVRLPSDPNSVLAMLMGLGVVAWLVGASAIVAGVGCRDGLLLEESRRARALAWASCLGGMLLWIGLSALA